mgnify:CR=1 FL=1
MEYIYGLSPVVEALRAKRRPIGRIVISTTVQPSRLNELIQLARESRIAVERKERRFLDDLARGGNHQGVIAVLAGEVSGRKSSSYTSADAILENLSANPLLVLLDNIEDPHNLGAILRTCDCAGVDGVFIPEHRAAGINETVAKTSAGAVEYVRVGRVTNLVPLIADLKERGFWVVGLEGGEGGNYDSMDFTVPTAIVMGSEGHGLRRLVKEKCDALVSIPMFGHVNSLNVSVATGVVLFEILRQRRQKDSAI